MASGLRPGLVRLEGRLDPEYPHWPGPRVAVEIESPERQGLFALSQPFPYLALGPSNLTPVELAEDELLTVGFTVRVVDLPASG